MTFTVLCAGARFVRQFTLDQAVAAALALNERKPILQQAGFTVLLQGDDNVVWIAHHQEPIR